MGITYPQYLVLMVLWENDEVTVNQISEKLLLNTNTLSPLLKRMEKSGIIERNRSQKDERSVVIQLTKKGIQLRSQAAPIPDELVQILLTENVKLEEVLALKEMMNKWISILSEKKENID